MDYIVYIFAVSFIKILGILPRSVSLFLTKSMASLAFHLDARHRRVMRKNLDIAFPSLSIQEKKRIAREAFRNMGRLATEVSKFPRLNKENIHHLVTYDPVNGFENFKRAYDKGKGVLFLTGHFSAWELIPFAQALYGYPLKFITRPLDNKYLDRFFNKYRSLSGNTPIPKKNSTRETLECLKKGGCVGILIDQNVLPSDGVFVDFFGKPACTTTGLAVLALRTGAAVVPGYLIKNKDSETYRIAFHEELTLVRTGDTEKDIVENTQKFTKVIEQAIREHPEQWLWGHRRWKTRPLDDREDIYSTK